MGCPPSGIERRSHQRTIRRTRGVRAPPRATLIDLDDRNVRHHRGGQPARVGSRLPRMHRVPRGEPPVLAGRLPSTLVSHFRRSRLVGCAAEPHRVKLFHAVRHRFVHARHRPGAQRHDRQPRPFVGAVCFLIGAYLLRRALPVGVVGVSQVEAIVAGDGDCSRTSTGSSVPTRPSPSDDHKSIRRRREVWIAASSVCSCSPPNASTATTPRWLYCSASTGFASPRHARPTSRIWASSAATEPSRSSGKAASPPPSHSFHARHAPSISPSANGAKDRSCGDATANASTDAPHTAGSRRSAGALVSRSRVPAHAALGVHQAALDAGIPLRDVQIAARHADPRTTMIDDRRRQNFDRHAADVVVAFVANG